MNVIFTTCMIVGAGCIGLSGLIAISSVNRFQESYEAGLLQQPPTTTTNHENR